MSSFYYVLHCLMCVIVILFCLVNHETVYDIRISDWSSDVCSSDLIAAHELLLVLKKEEATKRYNTANRIRSTCSQVFRYAIATARAQRDIAVDQRRGTRWHGDAAERSASSI